MNLHHISVFNVDGDIGDNAIRHDIMLEGNNNYINTTDLVESRIIVKKDVSKLWATMKKKIKLIYRILIVIVSSVALYLNFKLFGFKEGKRNLI